MNARIVVVLTTIFLYISINCFAQNGIIEGIVFDEINNEPLIGATVQVQDSSVGTLTDIDGKYRLENLVPGLYNIVVSYVGYNTRTFTDLYVTNAKPLQIDVAMATNSEVLEGVVITGKPFEKPQESPLSLTSLGATEIRRLPGGNQDISKVIQLLPGVSTGVSFRNDLLVRGGAPNENRFYLDGIEVPAINHFTTQGASGGSNGMINFNFIKGVDFYTGAFPAMRGNALSSVMEMSLEEGRKDRFGLTAIVGASDVGLTIQGPFTKNDKHSYLFSARRSYLQLLFKALKLPFLPTYNDFQFKTTHKFNQNHDLTIMGLGSLDDFILNKEENTTEESQYLLGNLPYFDQWTYTVGARYRYFREKSYMVFVVSRNMLGNKIYKYQNNDNEDPTKLIYNQDSKEAENKFRFEHIARFKDYKFAYGVNYEFARYTTGTISQFTTPNGIQRVNYDALIKLHKYGMFTQVSKGYFDERLNLSLGFRMDGNSYSKNMSNPFKQFSPRFSASYYITENLSVNFNTGLYYQTPAYTTLGYKDSNDVYVNKETLKYINNKQVVLGFAYTTSFNAKLSVEGFYKHYNNYPMSINNGISLANVGGNYGVVGDEPVTADSKGRSYGVEFSMQQKLFKGLFGILTYTFFRSEFTDTSGNYASASWDSRHAFNLALGYKFKKNWEIGVKARVNGGAPYTPINESLSSTIEVWNTNGVGIPDYSRLNTERTPANFQLDFRVDKKWFFNKWNLNLYLDLSNLTFSKDRQPDNFTVIRDPETKQPLLDPENPERYSFKYLENAAGSIIPTLGIIVEY